MCAPVAWLYGGFVIDWSLCFINLICVILRTSAFAFRCVLCVAARYYFLSFCRRAVRAPNLYKHQYNLCFLR